MQTSLHIINPLVVSKLCENKTLNEIRLSQFCFALWVFVCELALFFVHQTFSCYHMCTATVFDVVLRSKSTSRMNQQIAVKVSLLWNWLLDRWTFAQKTLLHLGNPKHISDVSSQQNGFFLEKMLLTEVKLIWLGCHCVVRGRPRKQWRFIILFEFFNSRLLTSISWVRSFFSENFFYVDA